MEKAASLQLKGNHLAITALVAAILAAVFSLVVIYLTDDGTSVQFLPVDYFDYISFELGDLIDELPMIGIPTLLGLTLLSQLLYFGTPALLLIALFSTQNKVRRMAIIAAFILPLGCILFDVIFLNYFNPSSFKLLFCILQLALAISCLFIKKDTRIAALIGFSALSLIAIICFAAAIPPFGNHSSDWWWRSPTDTLLSIAIWVCSACIILIMRTPSLGTSHSEKLNELVASFLPAESHRVPNAVQASHVQEEASDVVSEIKQYKELLDAGILTREEFDAIKKNLLGI